MTLNSNLAPDTVNCHYRQYLILSAVKHDRCVITASCGTTSLVAVLHPLRTCRQMAFCISIEFLGAALANLDGQLYVRLVFYQIMHTVAVSNRLHTICIEQIAYFVHVKLQFNDETLPYPHQFAKYTYIKGCSLVIYKSILSLYNFDWQRTPLCIKFLCCTKL